MSPRAGGPRRARALVSGAAVAAVAVAVLLALLVSAVVARRDAGVAAAYGLAATGAAVLAVGLLVLARAGAVARSAPARARALCTRCWVWALVAVVAISVAGGIAVLQTGSGAPVQGSTVGNVLLIPLVGLAVWQRATLRPARPANRPSRRTGGGESEPDRTAGAR